MWTAIMVDLLSFVERCNKSTQPMGLNALDCELPLNVFLSCVKDYALSGGSSVLKRALATLPGDPFPAALPTKPKYKLLDGRDACAEHSAYRVIVVLKHLNEAENTLILGPGFVKYRLL